MNDTQPTNKKEPVIWEERNLTEPEKNSLPQQIPAPNFITTETKNDSMPKVCENIGKEKKFNNKEYQKEYSQRPENKEKHRISSRNYARRNRENLNKKGKLWRDNNKEHCSEWRKQYSEQNKENLAIKALC